MVFLGLDPEASVRVEVRLVWFSGDGELAVAFTAGC
jgi:hypothetical protein